MTLTTVASSMPRSAARLAVLSLLASGTREAATATTTALHDSLLSARPSAFVSLVPSSGSLKPSASKADQAVRRAVPGSRVDRCAERARHNCPLSH